MAIGESLDLDLPTPEDNFSVTVAKLKAALEAIEEVLESQIDAGSLDITSAVSFGGSYAYNLLKLQLAVAMVAPTDNGDLYIDEDGELHIVTSSGDVRITNGGQLDITSSGGIGGDYGGANPAVVLFDDISGEYRFLEDDSPETWADLVADDLILKGTLGSVRLNVAATFAHTQTINFKSFPASGMGFLVYDSATSDLIDGSTASGEIDLPANLVVSEIRFSTPRTVNVPACAAQSAGPTWTNGSSVWTVGTSTNRVSYPVQLDEECRLVSWKVFLTKTSGSGVIGAELFRMDAAGGKTKLGATQNTGSGAAGDTFLGQLAINDDAAANCSYIIEVFGGGTTGDFFYSAQFNYSRPA